MLAATLLLSRLFDSALPLEANWTPALFLACWLLLTVVDESLWEGTAPGTRFGIPGGGRRLSFRLLHVFDMASDGLIRRENVWIDLASIMQQLGATPAAS